MTLGDIMNSNGRIEATPDGRVTLWQGDSDPITVALRVDRDVKIGFVGAPMYPDAPGRTSGCIQLRRDDARGWEIRAWGRTPCVTLGCGGETARIEFDADSWTTKISEPFDGHYAIRKARDMLARCGEFLLTWRDGWSPADLLISDLRKEGYLQDQDLEPEQEPDASIRDHVALYMAGNATASETIDKIAEELGGVDP